MLVQLPAVMEAGAASSPSPGVELEHVRGPPCAIAPVFVSRGVAASARTLMQCSPACCRPAPLPVSGKRASASYAAGQPVRNVRTPPRRCLKMLSAVGLDAVHVLRDRLRLRQIAFLVVPAVVFLTLGDVVSAALFQDWPVHIRGCGVRVGDPLAGSASASRNDACSPVFLDLLRAAGYAHALAICARARWHCDGYGHNLAAIVLPPMLGINPMRQLGLTSSASLGGWVESDASSADR